MSAWTAERRARQSAMIRKWRPWERSTGPRTPAGKARSARNAYRGGHRPRLRELIRAMNQALTAHREALLRSCHRQWRSQPFSVVADSKA
jgi:hypothetical protein